MNRKSMVLGIILVVAGVIMGLAEFDILPGSSFLFIIAAGFLAGYFISRRSLGLLIPGCIITAIAAFATMDEIFRWVSDGYFLIFIGLAFFAVFLIHTSKYCNNSWGDRNWPLIPAAILVVLGLFEAMSDFRIFRSGADLIIPIALIAIGLSVISKGVRGGHGGDKF